jgi:hypothetical protein
MGQVGKDKGRQGIYEGRGRKSREIRYVIGEEC